MTHHPRKSALTTLPKKSATTVLVRIMTLYGIEKSGVGSDTRVDVVCNLNTSPRVANNLAGFTFASVGPLDAGAGRRRTTSAPASSRPRCASAGYSVYHRYDDSYSSSNREVDRGGNETIAWSVLGLCREIGGEYLRCRTKSRAGREVCAVKDG